MSMTPEAREFADAISRPKHRRAFIAQCDRIGPESAMDEYMRFVHGWVFGSTTNWPRPEVEETEEEVEA